MKESTEIRTAMVLAAGFGTRMGELSRELPKCLLPVGHSTLLDLILQKIEKAGFQRVVINLHHQGEKIIQHLNTHYQGELEILYSMEPEILGTGGGIAFAEHFFAGETILTVNSDILSDISLPQFIHHYRQHPALATMAVFPSRNYQDYNLVIFDKAFHHRGFLGKGNPPGEKMQTGIFMGYQILTPQARKYLRPEFSSIITDFYLPALAEEQPLSVYVHRGEWVDLGTGDLYHQVNSRIKKREIALEQFGG